MITKLDKNKTQGKTYEAAIVLGNNFRISILTPFLIRLEYNENGIFEDHITQHVINRCFEVPKYSVRDENGYLYITTEELQLKYDKKQFSPYGLTIRIISSAMVWHYGDEDLDYVKSMNLGGTARTLDGIDGAVEIGQGLMSKAGYSVFNDSEALIIQEDGWISKREQDEIDLYFFGYGLNYKQCLKDLYKLTGNTPLLPRFALGNWWSRYYKYSEAEYKELILRFEKEKIPFSVAVIDMDWHLVDIDKKYGTGWTGYTWNKDLFPNPKKFIDWLHTHDMKTTLNVHPADGVRAFEVQYTKMCADLGIDPETKEGIEFDMSNPQFVEAYFKYINHPYEEMGIDFWWIDWQQGTVSKMEGLDPLWMLNHFYYLDHSRDGKRPLIFSRYAGIGSHRYPVGFSGDSVISWNSLDFQPYFTSSASNVGYTWWSHDIGGHMFGYRDDELAARWVQLGTFSPILRLHSNENEFNGKEPWKYNLVSEHVMKEALQLRHRLVPYLYTMNYLTYKESIPIVMPLYYEEPERKEAYEVKNEYYFGTEMLVCPITTPCNKNTLTAKFSAWIPKGIWIDFTNGRIYKGERMFTINRTLEEFPVLVKAGGIIPLDNAEQFDRSLSNPNKLELRVFAGADGHFILREDNNNEIDPIEEKWAETEYDFEWNKKAVLTIYPVEGNCEVVPSERQYHIHFIGFNKSSLNVFVNGINIKAEHKYDEYINTIIVYLPKISVNKKIVIEIENSALAKNEKMKHGFETLQKMQISYSIKQKIYDIMKEYGMSIKVIPALYAVAECDREVIDVLTEIILADIDE